jgi:hypothetical protein
MCGGGSWTEMDVARGDGCGEMDVVGVDGCGAGSWKEMDVARGDGCGEMDVGRWRWMCWG